MSRAPVHYPVDLTGIRFGRLVAVERTAKPEYYDHKGAWWRCKCDCGKFHNVPRRSLIYGLTRSCGCLRNEMSSARNKQMWAAYKKMEEEKK